ncbi:MAG: anthranilate synthase component I [Candidatus Margulisbacteria bacterium]|nr:anthranilate synthase component I [Candidatus Margulisiibacteriota bacterium]MBU1022584.1 anthranilate synthase component I [Candidatus Margulisiibacteriota bacterium]MBU1728870.1 anthranilate synthase component I [Candidatus Margulisiibacteriota bacterium]MBU1955501.1 anthranilate synthase component I [Candidatus Margulisiibacteriota bacterium]
MFPNKDEFLKLAKQGNVIPVYKEIVADMETPVSAYKKIESEYSFLLESVEGGENIARFSFLGADPLIIFRSKKEKIEIIKAGRVEKKTGDPFTVLKELLKQYQPVKVKGLPRFHGGFVGYVGYDNVRFVEDIPDKCKDDLQLYDIQLLLTDSLLAFDRVKNKILVISNALITDDPLAAYETACRKIDGLIEKLKIPVTFTEDTEKSVEKVDSNFSKQDFISAVSKAKQYIHDGDIIQVVLSQRFKTKTKSDPFDIYRALRTINPSPYMFYLSFRDMKMVGASPEVMVRLEEGQATVRPIAGTRPRGQNKMEDEKLTKELLADPKERAEHIMLVDLARNDLGRVCEYKTVKTTDLMVVEKYSHVMHIVSNVVGQLKPGMDAIDLLRACFPAGTVSGAPKVRAMQIIDELEKTRRGPYAGCVCYFDFSGDLDSCITIRTIVVKGQAAFVQAGAGIVADSDPEREYIETQNKAKAALKSLEA